MSVVTASVLAGPLAACATASSPPVPPPVVAIPEKPIRPRPNNPGSARAAAPLVAPGCVQLIVRHGDAGASTEGAHQDAERRRSVAFRNRCDFPVRVLYAVRPNGRLAETTEMLGVGETSKPTRIEEGFDRPGYAVCSYEAVPASYACRPGRSRQAP